VLIWVSISVVLIGSIFVLYKIKNFSVFLLTLSIPFLFVFIRNYRLCALDCMSEACVWAYLAYVPAFLIGVFLYLLVSIIQVKLYGKKDK